MKPAAAGLLMVVVVAAVLLARCPGPAGTLPDVPMVHDAGLRESQPPAASPGSNPLLGGAPLGSPDGSPDGSLAMADRHVGDARTRAVDPSPSVREVMVRVHGVDTPVGHRPVMELPVDVWFTGVERPTTLWVPNGRVARLPLGRGIAGVARADFAFSTSGRAAVGPLVAASEDGRVDVLLAAPSLGWLAVRMLEPDGQPSSERFEAALRRPGASSPAAGWRDAWSTRDGVVLVEADGAVLQVRVRAASGRVGTLELRAPGRAGEQVIAEVVMSGGGVPVVVDCGSILARSPEGRVPVRVDGSVTLQAWRIDGVACAVHPRTVGDGGRVTLHVAARTQSMDATALTAAEAADFAARERVDVLFVATATGREPLAWGVLSALAPGAANDTRVEHLRLQPGTTIVDGDVLDERGHAMAGSLVELSLLHGDRAVIATATTAGDGTFALWGPDPARVPLRAGLRGGLRAGLPGGVDVAPNQVPAGGLHRVKWRIGRR